MVIGGGAEGSLEEDDVDTLMRDGSYSKKKEVSSPANRHFCKGDSPCNHATASVQTDSRFQRRAHVGEDGMEFEDEGGVDVPSQ